MRLSWNEKLVDMPASVKGDISAPYQMRPGRDLLTLEEEGGLVGNQVARKVLSGIDEAGDGRSPQIGALEKIEVGGGAAPLSFDLNRALDHGENFTWFLPA